ncbi:MAG: phosphodiester glycosidase family protein [Clostridia bacterium]|nr:phosphodiester glycosidase family protein [Clostridia bacterium]
MNGRVGKRFLCLILILLMAAGALSFAAAEEDEAAFPPLNGQGFLDSGEFVYENPEEGLWRYASPTLKVEIYRRQEKKPNRVWYEAEVWCAGGSETPHMIPNDPEKWLSSADYPYKICRRTGTVLALSSDYCQTRMQQKIRVGIIIRNGRVYSEKTWPARASKFPNLDCLALFPDGDLQVFDSNERTAEEYLAAGARDVLAFGPWLLRDGELNEASLNKYGKSTAPRTAIGMVEKGHYFFMMLEGRIKRSKGAGITFLAERLKEKGCVNGFNLDGGDTSCIVFMGHQLCRMTDAGNRSSRRTSDILGVGTSALLPAEGDPW